MNHIAIENGYAGPIFARSTELSNFFDWLGLWTNGMALTF